MRRRRLASAALAALLAAGAPSAARGAEPLALRAAPPALVLGGSGEAPVTIEVSGAAELPRVTTSLGRIEAVRAAGPDRFVADYRPPATAWPQVAIVAAEAGGRFGWTAIPLHGRGVAFARSDPNAEIRVAIGDASFGPVRADAAGEARVPVVVPPGVDRAYHRGKPLDLGVPPTVHLHVALGGAVAPADVDGEVAVRVFAVTPSGAPRAAAPVIVEATHGVVTPLAETSPGELVGTWRLPRGGARTARVTARLADEPGLASVAALDRPHVPAPVHVVEDPPRARGHGVAAAPRIGVALSPGGLVTSYLGVEGAYRPPILGGRLALALELGRLAREGTDPVPLGDQQLAVRGRARYVPVLASARLEHALGRRQAVWAGAGAGVAHVSSEVSAGSGPVTAESGLVPVLHASAAWGLRAGRATPFAEARLAWHGAPDFVALRGSLTTLTLMVGCHYGAR